MKYLNNVICPIGIEKIDLNVSRITVFLNVILMGLFFYTNNPLYIVAVFTDYLIRAVFNAKYSPLRFISTSTLKTFKVEGEKINLAQKVFASRLGMLCALSSLIFFYFDNTVGTSISLGLLMVLSFADSVFNFCVGCLIYNYIVYPFYKTK